MPRDGSATRERILAVAEQLVIENGFSATPIERVIAEAGTSKGAFFHHFDSKVALARALVERYVAADLGQLDRALRAAAQVDDPTERLVAFFRFFEDEADELMAEQSSCLYLAVLTERQLADLGTADQIDTAVVAWRTAIAELIVAAGESSGPGSSMDPDALADHLFVTFEGAFLLCRATGNPAHMRRQLRVLRQLVESVSGRAID